MIHAQNRKFVVAIAQVSATNGATITSQQIDCRGFDYLSIVIQNTTSNAATNKPATLRLTESDDTVLTNFAAITALVGGGAGGFTIPNMETATSTKPYAILNVDLLKRKRYITLEVSPVTTQTFVAIAELTRADEAPTTASKQNVSGVVVNA